jgi:hypothetical protein
MKDAILFLALLSSLTLPSISSENNQDDKFYYDCNGGLTYEKALEEGINQSLVPYQNQSNEQSQGQLDDLSLIEPLIDKGEFEMIIHIDENGNVIGEEDLNSENESKNKSENDHPDVDNFDFSD